METTITLSDGREYKVQIEDTKAHVSRWEGSCWVWAGSEPLDSEYREWTMAGLQSEDFDAIDEAVESLR